jgi:flagellar protein FlaG
MIDRVSTQNVSLATRPYSLKENLNSSQNQSDNSKEQNINAMNNNKQEVNEVVESMNKFLQASHTSLKFVLHEKLNEYYVTVVDDISQEVVKEIPSKKLLDVYAAMTEFIGLVVDKKI